jgi:hypothetical protein
MTGAPAPTPRGLGGISALLVVAALTAGCGADDSTDSPPTFPDGSFAIVANADIGTGPTRLLIGVVAQDGTRLGSPNHPIRVEAAFIDDPDRSQEAPAEYAWIIEDAVGLYRSEFDFDQPGVWAITITPERGDPLPSAAITVLEETLAPNVGEVAPDAPTPTLRDHVIEDLTTDRQPDTRFYEMTLGEALDSGRTTVLVFSTPAYCLSATCGPLLDTVKELAPGYPDVNFIHIEVYTGLNQPGFAPDPAHLAPAAGPAYWNLPSEPWVFVIDETGTVTARFEGAVTGHELVAALS